MGKPGSVKPMLPAHEDQEDFRRRSARRRRERMRETLLDATEAACILHGSANVALQDILDAADVSRGTFYAHFDTIHDAIAIIARRLVDQAQADGVEMYRGVTDPLFRIAVGPQLFLTRAALQPAWASTIVESGEFLIRSTFVSAIRRDVLENMRRRNFIRSSPQAAVDLHVGAMMQGARTLQKVRHGQRDYIRSVDLNLLMAFGTSEDRAWEVVEAAAEDLHRRAPHFFEWWRPLE